MCMGWEVFHMYTLSNEEFNGKIPQIDPNAFVVPQVFLSVMFGSESMRVYGRASWPEAM